jgi:hypothetical protein
MTKSPMTPEDPRSSLRLRAHRLGLWGLLENWDELAAAPWLPELLECEERERGRRSLERRLRNSKLGLTFRGCAGRFRRHFGRHAGRGQASHP